MPNTKQASKRMRQDEQRRDHNKVIKTVMRSAIKNVVNAETGEEAAKNLPAAMSRIDKAAKTNLIHANAAARYKSRLQRAVAAK